MSRRNFYEQEKKKKVIAKLSMMIGIAVVVLVTIFVMYSKKIEDENNSELFAVVEEDNTVVPNNELEPTSFSKDKTIENNVKKDESIKVDLENTKNNVENEVVQNTSSQNIVSKINKEVVSPVVDENEVSKEEVKEENDDVINNTELKFQAPASGEIIKDYAMDTLIYSDTLDEWCTHPGIDIKADKTSVVQASEKGIVESIKNDPRYGLTIIIAHEDGFKTVYSNLLTTEFVKEGEEVEKGQTIATVGNTASFEVSDESHLHFEMYKDGVTVNPTIYFK